MRTYKIERSYDWNYQHGPVLADGFPDVPETPKKDFFGLEVNSRIGISAGLLLNSRWIEAYSRFGFDILTYKTVRSAYRECYPLPNWVYLDEKNPIDAHDNNQVLGAISGEPADSHAVNSSVSFGMPSKDPSEWMADVARAREVLGEGQVLVVSVVASPDVGSTEKDIVSDFADLAAMAVDAGAQVVEANFSCPNVVTAEAQIYQDPALSKKISAAIRKSAGSVPVLLKSGYFDDEQSLNDFLHAIDGSADGAVLINAFTRNVVDADGQPVFGAGREVSGILGKHIHGPSVSVVKNATEIIKRDDLDLGVVAVGGVSNQSDAKAYFDAGASAVTMGSAPMFDPGIAVRFKKSNPEW